MAPLKVLKRDRFARRIDIECPHCQASVPLGPGPVTQIEDGVEILGWCPGCQRSISVTLADLGGYLWTPAS